MRVGRNGRRGGILRRRASKRLLGGSGLSSFGSFLSLEDFLDGDALVLGFPLCFLAFDGFVLGKVFDVLGMVVRVVCLRFWRRVVLLCACRACETTRMPRLMWNSPS